MATLGIQQGAAWARQAVSVLSPESAPQSPEPRRGPLQAGPLSWIPSSSCPGSHIWDWKRTDRSCVVKQPGQRQESWDGDGVQVGAGG